MPLGFADIDTPGVATAHCNHFRRNKAIMDNDIGLLERIYCAHGQQVRCARPCADQRYRAAHCIKTLEHSRCQPSGRWKVTLMHSLCDAAFEEVAPEFAARLPARYEAINGVAIEPCQSRQ